MKRVFLIRHAEAGFSGGGKGDHGRELTEDGQAQARQLGRLLAEAEIEVILASSASRAAQTAEGLGLSAPVSLLDQLYNAGTPDLLAVLAEQDPAVKVVALVAHAPGIPALVDALAGVDSDPTALAAIRYHYPTATATAIDLDGEWSEPTGSRVVWVGNG